MALFNDCIKLTSPLGDMISALLAPGYSDDIERNLMIRYYNANQQTWINSTTDTGGKFLLSPESNNSYKLYYAFTSRGGNGLIIYPRCFLYTNGVLNRKSKVPKYRVLAPNTDYAIRYYEIGSFDVNSEESIQSYRVTIVQDNDDLVPDENYVYEADTKAYTISDTIDLTSAGGSQDIQTLMVIGNTISYSFSNTPAQLGTDTITVKGSDDVPSTAVTQVNIAMGVSTNIIQSVAISSNGATVTLPSSLEQYMTTATGLMPVYITFTPSTTATNVANFFYINGQFSDGNQLISTSVECTVDPTLTPSLASTTCLRKYYNHNSVNAVLANRSDYFAVVWSGTSQSYANPALTITVLFGDQVQILNQSNLTFNLGPYTTVPYTEGQLFKVFAYVTDNFGRTSEEQEIVVYDKDTTTTIAQMRAYLYSQPNVQISAYRVDAAGTPDEVNGTNIKVDYSWSISPVDYGETSYNSGTSAGSLVIAYDSENSNTIAITSATGSGSYTLNNMSIDLSFLFSGTITDFVGLTYQLPSVSVLSGEVFMDFRNGGSGIGIGMRATADDQMDVAWSTIFHDNVNVQGTLSSPTITSLVEQIDSIGTPTPVEASATTSLYGTVSAGRYLDQGQAWRYYQFPVYMASTEDTSFVILNSPALTLSLSSAGSATVTLPFTFEYTTYNIPQVMISTVDGGLVNLGAEMSNGNTVTIRYSGATSGTKEYFLTVMGTISNFTHYQEMTADTTINITGQVLETAPGTASQISYNDTVTQINATTVQAAIEALKVLLNNAQTTASTAANDASTALATANNASAGVTAANNRIDNLQIPSSVDINNMIIQQLANIGASNLPYSNTESGLTATNVQAAIDEVKAKAITQQQVQSMIDDALAKIEVVNEVEF